MTFLSWTEIFYDKALTQEGFSEICVKNFLKRSFLNSKKQCWSCLDKMKTLDKMMAPNKVEKVLKTTTAAIINHPYKVSLAILYNHHAINNCFPWKIHSNPVACCWMMAAIVPCIYIIRLIHFCWSALMTHSILSSSSPWCPMASSQHFRQVELQFIFILSWDFSNKISSPVIVLMNSSHFHISSAVLCSIFCHVFVSVFSVLLRPLANITHCYFGPPLNPDHLFVFIYRILVLSSYKVWEDTRKKSAVHIMLWLCSWNMSVLLPQILPISL